MSRGRRLVVLAGLGLVASREVRRRRDLGARRASARAVRDRAVDDALAHATRVPDPPFVAVVMAAFDEAGSVAAVIGSLPRTVCELPVCALVVDDGSTDATAAEARAAGAMVGSHARNLGQGDALRTGFSLAHELGAEVVVTMDADGQHDPAELPDLVAPVVAGEADYVQGSRFLGRYDDAGGARDLGIRGFTRLIRFLTGAPITDCTNGYRAIAGAGLARLELVEDRFSASEILIQAAGHGLRIREVPVHIRSREVGESKKPRGLGYAVGYFGAIVRSWARAHNPRRQVTASAWRGDLHR